MPRHAYNFAKMDLGELAKMRDALDAHLKRRIGAEQDALREQMAALAAIAEGSGASVASPPKRGRPSKRKTHPLKGRRVAPIFRGPNGETWSGRGSTPLWLVALEKKGKKRESFRIAK